MSLQSQFALHLQKLRRMRNLTQVELAQKTGLSASFISSLERGVDAPSFDSLEAIAFALDVPVRELFNFESVTNEPVSTENKPTVIRGKER
jgi:transcriptional regulator with XRE-family HTH domain